MSDINKLFTNTLGAAALRLFASLFACLFLFGGSSSAQTTQISKTSDGLTPPGLAPGAPAGAYPLSEFEQINLYNGQVNFTFPIVQKGRGGANISLPIKLNRPAWLVQHELQPYPNPHGTQDGTFIHQLSAYGDWWNNTFYRPILPGGVMYGRYVNDQIEDCVNDGPLYKRTNTFLTFIAPDGTEYKFIDKFQGGRSRGSGCGGVYGDNSRGTIWLSDDGSSATFVSQNFLVDQTFPDDPFRSETFTVHGYVMLKDGTRYDIAFNKVTRMRDRNGNEVKFQELLQQGPQGLYAVGYKITDSLNREIKIDYNATEAPYGQHDKITLKGFGGADRFIRVFYCTSANGCLRTTQGYDPTSQWSLQQLFPQLDNYGAAGGMLKVASILLPDGKSYQFKYNVYSELARIELPTGGAIEYDYEGGEEGGTASGAVGQYNITRYPANLSLVPRVGIYRRLVTRRIYKENNNNTLVGKTTYSKPNNTFNGSAYNWESDLIVTQWAADGTTPLSRSRHYFHGSALDSAQGGADPVGVPFWKDGREFKTETLPLTTATTPLRSAENTWGVGAIQSTNDPLYYIQAYPRITQTKTTWHDSNQFAYQVFLYDGVNNIGGYNNQIEVKEYDFGVTPPADPNQGTPTRRTKTEYVAALLRNGITYNYAADNLIHLRNLPSKIQVLDGANNKKAETIFEYDLYDASANHAALANCPNISGLDPVFNTGYVPRGNPTKVSQWLNTDGSLIDTWQQYDMAGNIVKSIDAEGRATTFEYLDRFGAPNAEARQNTAPAWLVGKTSFAFPTKITNALGQSAYTQYDYFLGVPVDFEDANGVLSSYHYNDLLDRPTQLVKAANFAAFKTQTAFGYDSNNRLITTTSDRDGFGDNKLKSEIVYDGLGRTTEQRTYEATSAYIKVETLYDGLGRVSQVSNPYRTGSPVWTTTAYDALGRVTTVTSPGNAVVTTEYSGTRVKVRDQANKERVSETDAFGRLSKVWEVRTSEPPYTVSFNFPQNGGPLYYGYLTQYSYDLLDNLTSVAQGVQTRTFNYDSLKRLLSATNPESGQTFYQYDKNGNLKQRTDARGYVTNLNYDVLNRVTSKTYSPSTLTPPVNFYYDTYPVFAGVPSLPAGNTTGRLVAVTYNGTSAGNYYGYDALGRVAQSVQQTDGNNYQFGYGYNRASQMTSQTYPSGRVINSSYDDAGRLSNVQRQGAEWSYAKEFSYAAHGAAEQIRLGNGLLEQMSYNTRLQVTQIGLGPTLGDTSKLKLAYDYGTATANNGNVQTITITPGAGQPNLVQTYSYDALNRLQTAQETRNGAQKWQQQYGYDRYGNRRITAATVGINGQVLTFSESNNRITSANYGYDAAGNLITDEGLSRTYDVENRMVSATGGSYSYDGEGRRVKKTANGVTTVFVYNAAGQLSAEYNNNATPTPGGGARYFTADHLGSTRLVTSGGSGAVKGRYDYLPFGEELAATAGAPREGLPEYGTGEIPRQKFTGKDRDTETNLDYFEARYYSKVQGRFTSPDPFNAAIFYDIGGMAIQALAEPQQWNRYSYVNNRPQSYVDPDGQNPLIAVGAVVGAAGGAAYEFFKQTYEIRTGARTDYNLIKIGAAGISGGIGGAVAGATGGLSLAGQLAVGSAASVVGGVLERSIDNDSTTTAFSADDLVLDTLAVVPAGVKAGAFGDAIETAFRDSNYFKTALRGARDALRRVRYRSASRKAPFVAAYRQIIALPGKLKQGSEEAYSKVVDELSKLFLQRAIIPPPPPTNPGTNPCGVKPGSGDGCGILK